MFPSISHRLSGEKYGMLFSMSDLEAAMLALSKFASTVVEELKARTRWIAEVETSLISKVFPVPKGDVDNTVLQQEKELS